MYRVLHEAGQQHRRSRQQTPQRKRSPNTHQVTEPNRLWCWDISWLPGPARGTWWYLYLIMDVFSRKIVGHEVYETEAGKLAAELIQKVCWREHLTDCHKPLILHSDNGGPMKASTFPKKLYDLGITPSYSRPRVSNNNAFAESAFSTLKYQPGFPVDGFESLVDAKD
nr:DDE-type integrase/transposase/recombinase [Halomonas sp. OfavH-34-E]